VAEPIAKPLPIAAVVLPAASRMSVNYLSIVKPLISAMPPALSEIGPKPSIVNAIEIVDSMPIAARAIPYILARVNETNTEREMEIIGMIVEL
jgi:hypothetical protein